MTQPSPVTVALPVTTSQVLPLVPLPETDVVGIAPRGLHRLPQPPAALRARVVVAAAAVGAFMAAGHSLTSASTRPTVEAAEPAPAGASPEAAVVLAAGAGAPDQGIGGAPIEAPQVLSVAKSVDPVATEQLQKGGRLGAERAAREAEARRPLFVVPAVGRFTSGYAARWGTFHYGIDIANVIGTPIVSAADGTVIEAGSAQGFGQWIRVQLDDGTINVYGHVNEFTAQVGDRVKAGDQIATVGNKGASTGPHLHFEVWLGEGGEKIDPRPWLADRGVFVG